MVLHSDRMAQHGLPDCCSNFLPNANNSRKCKTSEGGVAKKGQDGVVKKSFLSVGSTTVTFIPNPQPEMMGRKVKVKFMVENSKREEWFWGVISTYNGLNGKYGIYFPSVQQTVELALDDEDLKLFDD